MTTNSAEQDGTCAVPEERRSEAPGGFAKSWGTSEFSECDGWTTRSPASFQANGTLASHPADGHWPAHDSNWLAPSATARPDRKLPPRETPVPEPPGASCRTNRPPVRSPPHSAGPPDGSLAHPSSGRKAGERPNGRQGGGTAPGGQGATGPADRRRRGPNGDRAKRGHPALLEIIRFAWLTDVH